MSRHERLYLDHAATTPVLPEARAAVAAALETWANPSSPHEDGRRARASVEESRRKIADLLGCRHDVILTSGASEALQIVASRARVARRIVAPVEHDVVTAAMGPDASVLRVDRNGVVDLEDLAERLSQGPALVAVQLVNNETGVIQPMSVIEEMVRKAGSLLLADCAQGAGKMDLGEADFIAVSSHKLGGPPGAGALLVRDLATLEPSGGQERGYRRGTENWPAIAGFAAALETSSFRDAMPRLAALRRKLEHELEDEGGIVIAAAATRSPAIGAYALPGLASASQLVQLDLAGIAVSAGSACSSGSMKPSRVLAAMGVGSEIAGSVIRVSFGPSTGDRDINRFVEEWRQMARRTRAVAT